MQIEYKMEGFLHGTEKCRCSGDVLPLVGKETEQNGGECSHETHIQIPLQNSVTLQPCSAVSSVWKGQSRMCTERAVEGKLFSYSVCRKAGNTGPSWQLCGLRVGLETDLCLCRDFLSARGICLAPCLQLRTMPEAYSPYSLRPI